MRKHYVQVIFIGRYLSYATESKSDTASIAGIKSSDMPSEKSD